MKDIAHRGLDSSAAGLWEREIPKRHPALYGTRVRIYAVSFSRLGTPGTSIFENNASPFSYQRCKIVRGNRIRITLERGVANLRPRFYDLRFTAVECIVRLVSRVFLTKQSERSEGSVRKGSANEEKEEAKKEGRKEERKEGRKEGNG
ncbi:Uncharacterized protein DBV15_03418 [Temnothorax longispinosus]|uniref:Uncharacterized protein n=1 Tax=Temnothorax longispinosus TaxID=300112 RepID=A0A4S2KMD6_9HYME|nr:Uncharacterized protein DBV15_03418 [Temnothorax longispinosus]